ncbi:MAG TPA: hypothetical protein DCG48_09810 [Rhodospirillaceae bacterium]|nr:hypothetical protein [Rhodospirillaceae bacterium]
MRAAFFMACFQAHATVAEGLKEWAVQGLPANLNGVTAVRLPVNATDAANVLLHKIENQGYPLAEVRVVGDKLVVTYGEVVEVEVVGYSYGEAVKVNVEGFDKKVVSLIRGYVDHIVGTSPTTDQLSHAIALIDDIPGVTASISFKRLDDLGHYKAIVRGSQRRQAGVASIRNTPTERLESREIAVHQEFYSAFIGGDVLRLDGSAVTTNTKDKGYGVQVSHEFPVNALGTFAETRFSHYSSIGDNQYEAGQSANSKSTSGALVVGHAFSRDVEVADYAYGEFDLRTEDTNGSGSSDYATFRAAFFESHHKDDGSTYSWTVSGSVGQELSETNSTYALIRAGGGLIFWLPKLHDTAEVRIEGSAQFGTSDTPGFELFSFGGKQKQRGFSAFEYAGNHGADLTIEVAEQFQPWAPGAPILTPYAFADTTFMANYKSVVSSSRPRNNLLFSAGIGSKMTFFNGVSLDGWLAVPLYDGERPDMSRNVEFYVQAQYTW